MGKIGGLVLIAAIALTGCAPGAAAAPEVVNTRASVQPLYAADAARMADFISAVRASGSSYANQSAHSLESMAKEICQHYADGFTTEDLRASDGERLALVGEAARVTACR